MHKKGETTTDEDFVVFLDPIPPDAPSVRAHREFVQKKLRPLVHNEEQRKIRAWRRIRTWPILK